MSSSGDIRKKLKEREREKGGGEIKCGERHVILCNRIKKKSVSRNYFYV
jgi:hypothetical protein